MKLVSYSVKLHNPTLFNLIEMFFSFCPVFLSQIKVSVEVCLGHSLQGLITFAALTDLNNEPGPLSYSLKKNTLCCFPYVFPLKFLTKNGTPSSSKVETTT